MSQTPGEDPSVGWNVDQDAGTAPSQPAGRRRPPRSRSAIVAIVLLGLLVVLVLAAVLALPFLTVRSEGNQARANLSAALDQLRLGNLPAATDRVDAARADVEAADAAANGFRGDVVAAVPFIGNAVDDVRNLVSALDQAVAVAEVGVELYPSVLGEDAGLIRDGTVDLTALVTVSAAAAEVDEHLASAHTSLDAIGAGTPVVGSTIDEARDAALTQVVSLESTLDNFRPLLDAMPALLGATAPANYLVAVMNPAELRASGGAPLSMGEMSIDKGVITFGEAGNTTDFTDNNERIIWPPVEGNPWHASQEERLVNATTAPNWTASGEELLRAWEVTRTTQGISGSAPQGLIAIDVQAIAELFRITGPVEVPGYGTLNASNLVQKLVGNYDAFENSQQRNRLNNEIIPVLRQQLLEGGKFVQKAQVLVREGQARHFVAYFRDPAIQAVITNLGIDGELSTTEQDYLGVFTQNSNASKVDFWQRRTVSADVTLNPDGSADVVTTVQIVNDSPPYEQSVPDPGRGYYTRVALGNYLQSMPVGAQVTSMTVNDAPVAQPLMFVDRNRPVIRAGLNMGAGATSTVVVGYHVPKAAVAVSGGGLQYVLDINPQATVIPVAYTVLLRVPEGYREDAKEGEWTVNPDFTLTLTSTDGVGSHSTVTVVPE